MTMLKKGVESIGAILIFLGQINRNILTKGINTHELFVQIWKVTIDSLPTTLMAGFFVGAIMTVQFSMQVAQFDALAYLGALSTSGTVREVGPLLIAFMLSGKVGAYTSAELGSMKVTEQIDAIRCLGADPLKEVVIPRFIAIIISSFVLLLGGLVMSLLGGMVLGQAFAGVNYEEYLKYIPAIVKPFSILSGVLKSAVFAFVLALICTYNGYHVLGGARGVGRAVVMTAVTTMAAIVLADWFTSFIFDIALKIYEGWSI